MARLTLILGVLATVVYLLDGFRFMLNEWRNWRNKAKWLVAVGVGLCALYQVPTMPGATEWPAATCSNGDITTAIGNAADGDTVTVPSGNCTWTSSVSIQDTKGITVQGAGAGVTNITLAGFKFLVASSSLRQPLRITGFTLINSTSCAATGDSIQMLGTATDWRIDHNTFDGNTINLCYPIRIGDANENTDNFNYGLIDHNTFTNANNNASIFIEWDRGTPDTVLSGDYVWSQPAARGTAQAVYIEDNVFSGFFTTLNQTIDCRWACKYVLRYNIIHNPWISTHSGCTNGGRSPVWQEIYNNTFTDDSNKYTGSQIEMRSTSGVWFGNTFATTANRYIITIDHERSYVAACTGAYGPRADGTRAWDQNTVGQSGWRALGQPGWGPPQASDMSAYTFAGAFAWGNLNNGSLVDMTIANNNPFTSTHLVFGRDLYNEGNMASGTLAARPTTCANSDLTGRDVYNATDQNAFGVKLYQCSSTDTWTFHYEPYPYPHHLQGSSSSPIVIARIIRWMEVASVITGLGWHFRRPLLAMCLAGLSVGGTLVQLAPKSYDTVKVVSRDSAVKVLTAFNHLTKPRDR